MVAVPAAVAGAVVVHSKGDYMETCLICNKEKAFSTLRCKMCGMGVESMHKSMSFVFCCSKCVKHFEEMYEKASFGERQIFLEHDIIF